MTSAGCGLFSDEERRGMRQEQKGDHDKDGSIASSLRITSGRLRVIGRLNFFFWICEFDMIIVRLGLSLKVATLASAHILLKPL